MKSKKLRNLTAMLSIGALLASCSSDDILSESQKPLEKDTDFFINLKIANPSSESTRGDYEPGLDETDEGTKDEQDINEILFVFYNDENQYVGNATYKQDGSGDAQLVGTAQHPDEGSFETIINLMVPVTIAKGSKEPASVMAFVNPTSSSSKDLFNELNTAIGSFRKLDDVIDGDNHKGFAMNNSVHYDKTADDAMPTVAVPLEKNKTGLYTTKEAATAADATPVTIYVERVAAKVTLKQASEFTVKNNTANDASTISDTGKSAYTLNFKVLGWGLTNLEYYSFIVKNFRSLSCGNVYDFDNALTIDNSNYKTVNDVLPKTAPEWNNLTDHRSFWALSPSYFNDKGLNIPKCADDIYYPGGTPEMTTHTLDHRTFNDIYDTGKNGGTAKLGKYGLAVTDDNGKAIADGTTMYTLEHTMRADVVSAYQKPAVTTALVVGQYSITDNTGNTVTFDNFYIRKYSDQDGKIASFLYINDEELKKGFLEKNSILYKPDGTDDSGAPIYTEVRTEGTDLKDFTIYHPRKNVCSTSIPSRYLTVKLESSKLTKEGVAKYYIKNDDNTYAPVTTTNIDEVNQEIYQNIVNTLGGIEMYYKGYAYFDVPVEHLWTPGTKIGDEGFSPKTGQYGIVRNHSYTINIQGIDGIANGVSDPDAPIIPTVNNDHYTVKTELKVQKWRVVPQQDVTLKP